MRMSPRSTLVTVVFPWRRNLAYRLEGILGYGFDNEALRIGALVGLSFFPR